MSIKIKINNDGIWGDTDMDGVDASASEDNFAQMVADRVAAEYGSDVEVSIEQVYTTTVSGLDEYRDLDTIEEIKDLVSEVWQTWDWVVDYQ